MSNPETVRSSTLPRIAVIGGGPAGLTFARILQVHGLRATIYEQEKCAGARSQGGSLDLHTKSGLLAMETAGLMDQFKAKARPEGEQMRILDKDGKVFLDIKRADKGEGATERPEIDRTDLRAILVASLEEGTIQWGRKLVRVEMNGDHDEEDHHHHTLVFEDGVREEADLVIGADGTWSKVRPLLTDKAPVYTGITGVNVTMHNVDERYPNLAELVGDGLTKVLAPNKGLFLQRNSNGLICNYLFLRVEEGWEKKEFASASLKGPQSAREFLLRVLEGWKPEFLDFIRNCDDEPIWPRPIYALPVGHSWNSNKRGVTLIGDAAHVMSPFAGEGVNIAMLGARELAIALVEAWNLSPSVESLHDAIPAFERALCERAEQAARKAARRLELNFNARTPVDYVESFSRDVGLISQREVSQPGVAAT